MCSFRAANDDNKALSHALPPPLPFNHLQEDLLGTVTEVLGIDIANLDSETLYHSPLYGSSNMNVIDNRIIIEATIENIEKTNRLY